MENKIIDKLRDDVQYYGNYGQKWLSNSDIKSLLNNPTEFRLPVQPNENLEKGRLFHQLILEPEKAKTFPIADVSRRDSTYKKFLEENNLEFALKKSEADEIKELVDWFMDEKNEKTKAMKDYLFDFEAKYEEPMVGEIMGHPFKGKADIISKEMIIDLKTSGDVSKFTRNAPFYFYDTQAYIYQTLYGMPMVFFVVGKESKTIGTMKNKTTYDVGIFNPTSETIERAKQKVEKALYHYDKYFAKDAKESIDSIIYKGEF